MPEEEDYNKEQLEKLTTGEEYNNFRKHYTKEIQSFLTQNEGKFVMTHQLAGNIILDIVTLIEKSGYEIITKKQA